MTAAMCHPAWNYGSCISMTSPNLQNLCQKVLQNRCCLAVDRNPTKSCFAKAPPCTPPGRVLDSPKTPWGGYPPCHHPLAIPSSSCFPLFSRLVCHTTSIPVSYLILSAEILISSHSFVAPAITANIFQQFHTLEPSRYNPGTKSSHP